MKESDWPLLCKNIHERKCVLFIGSEFPIGISDGRLTSYSSFAEFLIQQIEENYHIIAKGNTSLSELVTQVVNVPSKREEFNLNIKSYLKKGMPRFVSPVFMQLMELPFTFIVDTNYSDFFSALTEKIQPNTRLQKYPQNDFYNYKGKRKETAFANNSFLDNIAEPCFYNLFGSYTDHDSIAISEHDLIELLTHVIAKNPELPTNIFGKLSRGDISLLFIGFGIVSKNWYFRILLHLLKCWEKAKKSYVMECLDGIDKSQENTVFYFQNGLNTGLYEYDTEQFVNKLTIKYNEYAQEQPADDNAPSAFLSYKSEDINFILELEARLIFNGIKTKRDKLDMRNESWKKQLSGLINGSDIFILAQSKLMKQSVIAGETYICTEIQTAIDRSEDDKAFAKQQDFLFPIFIDHSDSCIRKYPDFADIHSSDLTPGYDFNQKVDKLAKEIKMTYERGRNRRQK